MVGLETEHPELVTYPLGDFDELGRLIDFYLHETDTRREFAKLNRAHVLGYHTYQHRMARLIAEVKLL